MLGLLWLLLMRTRWGRPLRAASENRSMLAALGVNQAWLFTSAFTLGAFLAGLGGALAAPRTPATLGWTWKSSPAPSWWWWWAAWVRSLGAFLAALLISLAKSLFVFLGQVQIGPWVFNLSKPTLLAEFAVSGRGAGGAALGPDGPPAPAAGHAAGTPDSPCRRLRLAYGALLALLIAAPLPAMAVPGHPADRDPDCRAVRGQPAFPDRAGRHDQFRPRRLAWAPTARRCCSLGALPMEAALLLGPLPRRWRAGVRLVLRAPVRRLPGHAGRGADPVGHRLPVDDVTGGSNGLTGLWPAAWLSSGPGYYYLTPALCALGVWWLRRLAFAPLGAARRARLGPCAPKRWHDTRRVQWAGFVARRHAGSLYAFSRAASRPTRWPSAVRSTGWSCAARRLQSLAGPLAARRPIPGCRTQPRAAPNTGTRAGLAILALVMAFPDGRRRGGALDPPAVASERREMSAPAPLQVRDLRKSFGGIDALAGVSFTLQAGQMLAPDRT